MLHLVTAAPSQGTALGQALAAARAGDDVVLMHAAVLAVRTLRVQPGIALHAMAPDLAARGIEAGSLAPGIAALDDGGLVELAVRHAQSLTWD
jgi:sulfur relay protein TusB/DsrH